MARLPYLRQQDLPPDRQPLLAREINAFMVLAHSPDALAAFAGFGAFTQSGTRLDNTLRELLILQIAWLSQSAYEWSHHVQIALAAGVTPEQVRAIMRTGPGVFDAAAAVTALGPLRALAVRAAFEIHQQGAVSAECFAQLASQLDKAALVDLIVCAGFYVAAIRILTSLGVDVEPPYLPYLEQYPLRRTQP